MSPSDYPQWLVDLSTNPIVVLVAALASIVSVGVSIAIYRKLYRINAQIVLRKRSQAWHDMLRASTANLAPLLADPVSGRNQIREILVQSRPTLRALERSMQPRSADRRRVNQTLGQIGSYMGDSRSRIWVFRAPAEASDARPIYEMMLEVIQALSEDIVQAEIYRAKV
jgi:hypothetical protein